MLKFKKGDTVKITSGKDKGRDGKIDSIDFSKMTATIAGVNTFKRHVKRSATADGKGGIFEFSRPLPFSKMAIVCPKCKKAARIGFLLKESKKLRVCKKCSETFI